MEMADSSLMRTAQKSFRESLRSNVEIKSEVEKQTIKLKRSFAQARCFLLTFIYSQPTNFSHNGEKSLYVVAFRCPTNASASGDSGGIGNEQVLTRPS